MTVVQATVFVAVAVVVGVVWAAAYCWWAAADRARRVARLSARRVRDEAALREGRP